MPRLTAVIWCSHCKEAHEPPVCTRARCRHQFADACPTCQQSVQPTELDEPDPMHPTEWFAVYDHCNITWTKNGRLS